MGVVVESDVWEPTPICYLFLAFSCFSSIFLFPHFTGAGRAKPSSAPLSLDGCPGAPFSRFQRAFLLIYSLASLTNGLETLLGESEFMNNGFDRSQMVLYLSAGVAAVFLIGTFLGMFSDVMGPRNFCILFCILHLSASTLRFVTKNPNWWITSIFLSLASSVLLFGFETWMVSEHERQSHRQDLLVDTFWLMTYFGSAALIGSQMLANLLSKDLHKGISGPTAAAVAFLSLLSIIYTQKEWKGHHYSSRSFRTYVNLFTDHALCDKRIWLLMSAQACYHFSESIFWLLWASIIVADGREARLSTLYPCFLGSRMLGSTCVPWLSTVASPLFNKDYHIVAFAIAGFCFSVVAYDYQEIAVLVMLFCIYNFCSGLILPSLAHLRAIYVPSELRGGMISLSLAPSNVAILFFLIQGGYRRSTNNSTIVAASAVGLIFGACCLRTLSSWRKQSRQNSHHL